MVDPGSELCYVAAVIVVTAVALVCLAPALVLLFVYLLVHLDGQGVESVPRTRWCSIACLPCAAAVDLAAWPTYESVRIAAIHPDGAFGVRDSMGRVGWMVVPARSYDAPELLQRWWLAGEDLVLVDAGQQVVLQRGEERLGGLQWAN